MTGTAVVLLLGYSGVGAGMLAAMVSVPGCAMTGSAKAIGSWLGSGVTFYAGYVWAKHGLLWGFAVWGAFIVVSLALLGALSLTEKKA